MELLKSQIKQKKKMEEFVCYNRALLVRLCKRNKIRGYTRLRKCDLVTALGTYFAKVEPVVGKG